MGESWYPLRCLVFAERNSYLGQRLRSFGHKPPLAGLYFLMKEHQERPNIRFYRKIDVVHRLVLQIPIDTPVKAIQFE